MEILQCMIPFETFAGMQPRLPDTCLAKVHRSLSLSRYPAIVADSTIYLDFLLCHEMRYARKAVSDVLCRRLSTSFLLTHSADQLAHQPTSVFQMCQVALACRSLTDVVEDVAVYHGYLEQPEKDLSPPLETYSTKVIAAAHLIGVVNSSHFRRIIYYYRRLRYLLGDPDPMTLHDLSIVGVVRTDHDNLAFILPYEAHCSVILDVRFYFKFLHLEFLF